MKTKAPTTTENQDVETKPKPRESGTGYKTPPSKKDHWLLNKETELYEIDTQLIDDKIRNYLIDAEEKGKYSISGMCIALDVGRDTLRRWRRGFVSDSDMTDEGVIPNNNLCECLRAGDLRIHQHWEEDDNKSMQTKYIRMMESAGVIAPAKQQQIPYIGTLNLGIFDRFAH